MMLVPFVEINVYLVVKMKFLVYAGPHALRAGQTLEHYVEKDVAEIHQLKF